MVGKGGRTWCWMRRRTLPAVVWTGEVDDLVARTCRRPRSEAGLAGDGEDDAAGAAGPWRRFSARARGRAGRGDARGRSARRRRGRRTPEISRTVALHDVGPERKRSEKLTFADLAFALGVLEGVDGAEVEAVLVDEEGVAEDADGGRCGGRAWAWRIRQGGIGRRRGGRPRGASIWGEVDGGDGAAVPAGTGRAGGSREGRSGGRPSAGDAALLGAAGLAAVLNWVRTMNQVGWERQTSGLRGSPAGSGGGGGGEVGLEGGGRSSRTSRGVRTLGRR